MITGLDRLGYVRLFKSFPEMIHLLRPNPADKLSYRKVVQLLRPSFSEEGSNKLKLEKEVYGMFLKYCRECFAGRRIVVLEDILVFVTCSTMEPYCGFSIQPTIKFDTVVEVGNIFKKYI